MSFPMFKKPVLTGLIAIVGCGLVSCTPGNDVEPSRFPYVDTASTEVRAEHQYPAVLGNCGRELVVREAPQRVVSLNQGMTEMLLSMGLEDRVVGTGTWTDPILPNLAEANEGIERLAENNPSMDAVLATEPDLVVASFANPLSEGRSGSFDSYAELGIPAYVAFSDCTKVRTGVDDDGERATKIKMDDIYQDIRDLGSIMDESEAASRVIRNLDARLSAVGATNGAKSFSRGEEITVAYWFSTSTVPYMAGGYGAPQLITDMLELDNVFEDSTHEWPQVPWEVVAGENPDVLILGNLTRKSNTAESATEKIEFLKNHPVTREMDAVKNDRFIVLAGTEMNPSIRTIHAVEKVAAGLQSLGLR